MSWPEIVMIGFGVVLFAVMVKLAIDNPMDGMW